MILTILNWNIGGAKVLESKTKDVRNDVMKQINEDLAMLIDEKRPDIITLQEVVAFKEPSDTGVINIIQEDIINKLGYKCFFFPLINSLGFSSQAKWKKIASECGWDYNTYFVQGNAMLFRNDAPLFPFWDLSRPEQKSPGLRLSTILKQQEINPVPDLQQEVGKNQQNYLIEHIHLEDGVYFGDRNTEPRAALIAHMIFNSPILTDSKPIDIFIINVHLVTIMKERVGIPATDSNASQLRLKQLEIIFDGIISRYNSWFDDGFPQRGKNVPEEEGETFERHQPVWLLCGDFNFTENSIEHEYIMRRNFIDTTPQSKREKQTEPDPTGKPGVIEHNGTKAKGAGNPATLTLDYIFAGPKFVAFDPIFTEAKMLNNTVEYSITSSDHYPIISKIPMYMVR
ncbi:MAG: hypothetical protein GY797_03330 [Deltaproteobacteria bacterium]|nr:hypothetical protein [Deltaproteobacteria bacterium]